MEEEKEKQLDPAITQKPTTSPSFNLSQKDGTPQRSKHVYNCLTPLPRPTASS